MKAWAQNKHSRGFTIVELLIVVVVIAILAAITVVAYSGIQNRTKDSAVRTSASQVGKKALTYAPLNADLFPLETTFRTELSLPGNDPNTAVYDYYVSDDRKSFCISVSNTTTSPQIAYAFTQQGQVVEGRCVKNLVPNPSFEVGISGWTYANSATSPGVSGTASLVGVNGLAVTTSSTSDSGVGRSYTYEAGKTYTLSCTVQSKVATSYSYKVSAQGSGIPSSGTAIRTLGLDQQARIAATWTTPSTVTGMLYCLRSGSQSGSATFNVDGVMLTETEQPYSYGDGSTTNWAWTGAANASTSFGPASVQ